MRDEIKIFKELLEKYKVTNPLPEDVQDYSLKRKRKNLIAILKKLNLYSPIFGLILFIFFFMKRFGISLTIAQSSVALIVSSVIATAAGGVAGYNAVKVLIIDEVKTIEEERTDAKPVEERTIERPVDKNNGIAEKNEKEEPIAPAGNMIYFPGLISNGAEDRIINNISRNIRIEVLKLKGQENVGFDSTPATSRLLITGSVEKLETNYMITLRITERKTRRIIFASSWDFESENEIGPLCQRIAREISGKL